MNQNDELPVKAWLIEGSRVYQDTVVMEEERADRRIAERKNDKSTKTPLVLLSGAQRIRDERDRLHDQYHDLLSELSRAYQERDRLRAENERLMEIARWLDLATDEGDDIARGTHYVDEEGCIRCKGSFLATIGKARAALAGEKE